MLEGDGNALVLHVGGWWAKEGVGMGFFQDLVACNAKGRAFNVHGRVRAWVPIKGGVMTASGSEA